MASFLPPSLYQHLHDNNHRLHLNPLKCAKSYMICLVQLLKMLCGRDFTYSQGREEKQKRREGSTEFHQAPLTVLSQTGVELLRVD